MLSEMGIFDSHFSPGENVSPAYLIGKHKTLNSGKTLLILEFGRRFFRVFCKKNVSVSILMLLQVTKCTSL